MDIRSAASTHCTCHVRPTGVTGFATSHAQVILEPRQRTDAAGDFYPDTPGECGDMRESGQGPAPGEKAAENHERREGEMRNNKRVGEQ